MQKQVILASVTGNDVRLSTGAPGEVRVEKSVKGKWVRMLGNGGTKNLDLAIQKIFNTLEGTTKIKVSKEESQFILRHICVLENESYKA